MEDVVRPKRGFKKANVYKLMLLTFLAVTGIFTYSFSTQTKLESFASIVDPNAPPQFNRMIYGGFGEDAFKKPMDVTVSSQFVYVTDTRNKRVQVFDLSGTPVFKFGKEGEGPGQFKFPYGIAGDNQGNIYVADLYNGCISVHDSKGKFIKYFAEKDPREKLIEAPGGLRIYNNRVYVTDIQQSKVLVFDLAGKKLQEIGKLGVKPGELRAPNAVTVDKEGNIYVVDTGNQRVQEFDKNGKFIREINGSKDGKGASLFVNPRGIGIDSRGNLVVVSNLTHFIYAFDKAGKQVYVLGGNGSENDKFSLPNGLFITENDEIYVTDTGNQRVAVFQ